MLRRWFNVSTRNVFSVAGIRSACRACSSTSCSLRNNPSAGFAAFQAPRSSNSQSSGAAYRWQTIVGSADRTASSSHMLIKSASVGACVLITISKGLSCAPCEVVIASTKSFCGPLTCPISSRMARIGDRPCAVLPSAARALNSVFIASPISRLPLGTMRTILDSSGDNCTIFAAKLNTSAACSRDSAPLTIWLFNFASGPTRCASKMHAISAVLPFFLPTER